MLGFVARWRQALRVGPAEACASGEVRVHDRLPADQIPFVGREHHLEVLRNVPGGSVVLLTGMAGVGKTQLAVHAGHQLRGFDITLFVNLRGFHPDQPPAEPAAVLDGFLRLLGVAAQQIPRATEARTAAFQERLAGRRVLVILDNAADEDQIRPLLPGGTSSLTLVTSRHDLPGLEAASRLVIDVLTPDEAAELLARAVPQDDDPSAYARVARRCDHLPLALTVVAGQMAATPDRPVSAHADRLDERHRKHRLDDGVELALHLSYQQLPPPRKALLRRLAAHPGQDLDDHAAAALLDADVETTHEHLRQLVAEHLVEQPAAGRFALHDLVREHAAQRAHAEDRPQDRRAALTRLFDHYLYGAAAAMDLLYPAERHRRPTLPSRTPVSAPADLPAALAWLDAERPTLVAVCLHAARNGWPEHAVRLAAILYSYLDNGGHPADAIAVHSEARTAARACGDRAGEAGALVNLAVVHWQLGRYPEATTELTEALTLFRRIGDARGEARALGNLGVVHTSTRDYAASAGFHSEALASFIALGDRVGEANTLTNLGDVYVRAGRLTEAADHHERALAIFRDLGHRGGEATALTNLGDVHVRLGRHAEAFDKHEAALAVFGELGERYGQTCALNGRGEALTGLGHIEAAVTSHRAALRLALEIDDPEEQARARVALDRLAAR